MYILGTAFLLLGTIMNAAVSIVNASTVNTTMSTSSLQAVQSSKTASLNSSSNSNSTSTAESRADSKSELQSATSSSALSEGSSKSMSETAKASSSQSLNSVASKSDSQTMKSEASVSPRQNLAAASSVNTPTSGKIGETTITTDSGVGKFIEPHFQTKDGDIVYCYDWQKQAPDQIGTLYNQYKFYDGMQSVTGDQTKVNKVAAALEAGYHKDASTNTYNVAPQFQNVAQQSFNAAKKDPNLTGTFDPSTYTLGDFERDVTQSVIWYLDGASDGPVTGSNLPEGYLATHTELGKEILAYAENHPLDQQTAYPTNVSVKDSNGTVSDSNPLVMDRNTKMSQPFQLNNYNGSVAVTDLPKGYEIVDENGNPVSQVESGKNYRVKYTGQSVPSNTTANDVANKIQAKASYESLKDSNFFSAQMTNASPDAVNPWQNMVNLSTIENSFNFPIVWQNVSSSSSSSSSAVSSSSQANTSSVKSSSAVSSSQASSSSVKSSLAESSSKSSSSSVKSSLAESSSKSSSNSVKSSTVSSSQASSSNVKSSAESSSQASSNNVKSLAVSSSKSSLNSVKSSTVSSSQASSSSVKSGSAVSSSQASSNSVKNSSAVSSSQKNTSSTKQAVVVGVHNNTNSGKGTGHGQGEGHGMPQTGEAVATSLIAAGVVLLAVAGTITFRKRN